MNGRAGSASLCRFPINAGPGDVIQFEPINPIRNSYDMSGYLLSQFRVELLDPALIAAARDEPVVGLSRASPASLPAARCRCWAAAQRLHTLVSETKV